MPTNETTRNWRRRSIIDDHRWLRTMSAGEAKMDAESWLRRDTTYGERNAWSVRKWRYGGFMVHWTFSCFSLLFISSLDLGLVQMASARVLPPATGGGVSPWARSAKRLPSAVLIGSGTYWILWVRTQNGCLIGSFLSFSSTGGCSPGGLMLKRKMM